MISDELIKAGRLSYNIHALKLRELSGYKIKSRDFAKAFRSGFKPYEHAWPNVSTANGPQTFMEGWLNIDLDNLSAEIQQLCYKFLEVHHLIDALLADRKR